MKVTKKVVPAVIEVIIPEKITYVLELDEDEIHILRAYLGQTASNLCMYNTYAMYTAVRDAMDRHEPKFKIVELFTPDRKVTLKVKSNDESE